MKASSRIILIFSFLLSMTHGDMLQAAAFSDNEEQHVKNTISNAIDAMYNNGNVELIKKYYHPDYDLLLLTADNTLYKMSLNERISYVEKELEGNNFPPKETVTIEFEIVDVAHSTATVKFDYFKSDRRTCIDVMTLYKFKEGWRIVSQTTHHVQD